MRSIISQSVVLPATAESLFAMYTDPAKHAVITGRHGAPCRPEGPRVRLAQGILAKLLAVPNM